MSRITDAARRAARQHAETIGLMGVDFLPRRAGGDRPAAEVEPKPPATSTSTSATETETATGSGSASKADLLAALRERYEREAEVPRRIEGWTSIVFGDGSAEARLMFIGEAPGADEDARGIPFVGRAGQKLNDMIAAMGLRREDDVYIANVLKVRPPNNRTPTPEEAALDGPWLIEQVRIIEPAVIVTLGRPAAHFMLNSTASMGSLRGQWHAFEGIPVMPTYHPAYLLRAYTPENRKKVWSDLRMAMERLGL